MQPKPPSHLSPETKRWWSTILGDYDLEPHHLRILQLACEAWDRKEDAREQMRKDGIVIPGRTGGVRQHPGIAIERDCALRFSALVRQLGLDEEAQPMMGRPPNSLKYADPWSKENEVEDKN